MDRPHGDRTSAATDGRRSVQGPPGGEGQARQPVSKHVARAGFQARERGLENQAALRTLLFLLWLLFAAQPASAQNTEPRVDALGSEPQPRGQWRLGAFVGAARNSPINPKLGQTPNRDHLFLGLQAQTTVLKIGASRLSWGVQLVPLALVKGRSAPRGYHGAVDDEGLIPGDDTAYAFGVSPFALEYALPLGSRLGIFGAAAGGLIFFTKPFPVPEGKSNNFTIEYGGGLSLRVGRRTWLQAGYKYHHLSNAYRELVNPGLDGHVGYLGFWKALGRGSNR